MRTPIIFALVICLCCAAEAPQASAAKSKSPIETVKVNPLQFNALTGVEVEPVVAEDSDVYEFEYRWFVNGEENFFQTSNTFPGELLRRGDKLSVEVTPIDFQGERLEPFVGLPLEAVNASPSISSNPPEKLSSGGYVYQVEASDLDGDSIRYHLEESPPGMKIDKESGMLTWFPDKFPEGVSKILVVAEDDFGGRAEQRFELKLSFEPKGQSK